MLNLCFAHVLRFFHLSAIYLLMGLQSNLKLGGFKAVPQNVMDTTTAWNPEIPRNPPRKFTQLRDEFRTKSQLILCKGRPGHAWNSVISVVFFLSKSVGFCLGPFFRLRRNQRVWGSGGGPPVVFYRPEIKMLIVIWPYLTIIDHIWPYFFSDSWWYLKANDSDFGASDAGERHHMASPFPCELIADWIHTFGSWVWYYWEALTSSLALQCLVGILWIQYDTTTARPPPNT